MPINIHHNLKMRPTFDHNGHQVRAAGILVRAGRHTLLRRVRGRYEDIGGKTDPRDTCALDTAVREAAEETNGKLLDPRHTQKECEDTLRELLEECETHYNPRSKYLCYLLKVPTHVKFLPMRRFGRCEITEWGGLQHYYKWMITLPRNLHPRLWLLR